ncbi:lactadherin-like [Antedon mediterranea]|uniref:lactadherin-like n=1 Tax=Antedon mediterranea TaxID=105859 RepID=UPI003AF9BE2B
MACWTIVCVFLWIILHMSKESCDRDLGIESGDIPDNQMNASSSYDNVSAHHGRLHGNKSWSPATANVSQWIQVDLGNITYTTQVATQGGSRGSVSKYSIKYGIDGTNFIDAEGGGMFIGNVDEKSVVINSFSSPVNAQYIRIYLKAWVDWPSLRIELYRCAESCNTALGIESGAISDNQMTADSSLNYFQPYKGRLHGRSCWASATGNPKNHWIQVDLGNITKVTKVATQGNTNKKYVEEYRVKYSTNGTTFWEITAEEGGRFPGNFDKYSVVINSFNSPVNARYIRIYPYKARGWPSLRMELYGCPVIDTVMDVSINVNDSKFYYGAGDKVKTDFFINTTGLTSGTDFTVTLTAENMENINLVFFTCTLPTLS